MMIMTMIVTIYLFPSYFLPLSSTPTSFSCSSSSQSSSSTSTVDIFIDHITSLSPPHLFIHLILLFILPLMQPSSSRSFFSAPTSPHPSTASSPASHARELLAIIVGYIYFQYNGVIYKQTSGLPMGSRLSDLLSITYVDTLKHMAISICLSCSFFFRYDDVILITMSFKYQATNIHHAFNIIDTNIKFVIEHQDGSGTLNSTRLSSQDHVE